MNNLFVLFSSWSLGVILSIVVMMLYFSNLPPSFTFDEEELKDHNQLVAYKLLNEFLIHRSEYVQKRRSEITIEQQRYLDTIQKS